MKRLKFTNSPAPASPEEIEAELTLLRAYHMQALSVSGGTKIAPKLRIAAATHASELENVIAELEAAAKKAAA